MGSAKRNRQPSPIIEVSSARPHAERQGRGASQPLCWRQVRRTVRTMIERFQLELADSHMLAPGVRHLAFRRADGAPFKFTPGQFIQIHFNYDDGKPTKRSYSVGTPAEDAEVDRLELAVSYVDGGAATKLLGNLEHGGTVEASGPYGRFCLMDDDANQRYVLIATGTGITPYRAMLPTIEKDRKSTRLNSSHPSISYAVFCLKKKTTNQNTQI